MRVLVTGATGYIGRAVAEEFIARGHSVTGLVRSAERASALPTGAAPLVGDIAKAERWSSWLDARCAAAHDALVHCAFDSSIPYEDACVAEAAFASYAVSVARAPGSTLRAVVLTTSLVACFGQDGDPDESIQPDRVPDWARTRFSGESVFLADSSDSVRTCAVRPGWVYGGRGGVLGFLAGDGSSPPLVVNGGSAVVSLVHVRDLAGIYASVVEDARAHGAFNATGPGKNRLTWRELAERVSHAADHGGKVCDVTADEATKQRKMSKSLVGFLSNNMMGRSSKLVAIGFDFKEKPLFEDFDKFYCEASSH